MGTLITCWEQNSESPFGYEDLSWNNPDSESCKEYAELCDLYKKEPYGGQGSVCDRSDPRTGLRRDVCKMSVMYSSENNGDKIWQWRCWELSQCPLKDEKGNGKLGCLINNKRISCCCQDDYCTGNDIYIKFAKYGNPTYNPNIIGFDELIEIDTGDIYVEYDINGYTIDGQKIEGYQWETENEKDNESENENDNGNDNENDNESGNGKKDKTARAKSAFMNEYNMRSNLNGSDEEHIGDIVMIFAYCMIGILSLGIGVYIGTKWKRDVQQKQYQFNDVIDY